MITSPGAMPAVSVAGGLGAAALLYALARRRGMHPHRFVLAGVGVGVALSSVVQLYLTGSELEAAEQIKLWLTGSLNGRGWDQAGPLATVLLFAVPTLVWAGRAVRPLGLDPNTAAALGVRVDRVRLGLTVLGVVLAATATGAAGPIGFFAPHRAPAGPPPHPYAPPAAADLGADRRGRPGRRRSGRPYAAAPAGDPGRRADRARRGAVPAVAAGPAAVRRMTYDEGPRHACGRGPVVR